MLNFSTVNVELPVTWKRCFSTREWSSDATARLTDKNKEFDQDKAEAVGHGLKVGKNKGNPKEETFSPFLTSCLLKLTTTSITYRPRISIVCHFSRDGNAYLEC